MKPSVTPSTMLASRARLKPCSALDSLVSSSRATVTTPSSIWKLTRSVNSRESCPLEPLTLTRVPATSTSTPEGKVTGIFPIRLISPHLADDLATETTPTRLTVGEEPLTGGDDGHAQP